MTISEELKASILRYYHVEKWRVGTISSQLGVHHGTIKRVLSDTGADRSKILVGNSMIDPYLSFVLETLERHPKLTASSLYGMVKERGYPGGVDHFRHLISFYRPRRAEAYLRLRTLPGEQAQVDWGHFGHLTIGKAKRPLMAFVMVLSFSRKIFLRFYLNQRMESFLSGHVEAFSSFSGVPRVLLYDNLKSAVLERLGDAIRFNPTLLSFAAYYRFEPRPVAVARGNEKGRVERAIRYVRDNFFAARKFRDLEDLNTQAQAWCQGVASNRLCPEDRSKTVGQVFEEEKPRLTSLPDNPYPTHETEAVRVGKTPYIRFDWNDYSVPHAYVQKTLTIHATTNQVRILEGTKVLAEHERSYDKSKQMEQESHIEALSQDKKKARLHRGQHRLTHVIACGSDFLKAASLKSYPLKSLVTQLIALLDDYGAADLEEAMQEALNKEVPHPNAVRLALQKLREVGLKEPPIRLDLSKNKKINELVVKPHNLSDYDVLAQQDKETK